MTWFGKEDIPASATAVEIADSSEADFAVTYNKTTRTWSVLWKWNGSAGPP